VGRATISPGSHDFGTHPAGADGGTTTFDIGFDPGLSDLEVRVDEPFEVAKSPSEGFASSQRWSSRELDEANGAVSVHARFAPPPHYTRRDQYEGKLRVRGGADATLTGARVLPVPNPAPLAIGFGSIPLGQAGEPAMVDLGLPDGPTYFLAMRSASTVDATAFTVRGMGTDVDSESQLTVEFHPPAPGEWSEQTVVFEAICLAAAEDAEPMGPWTLTLTGSCEAPETDAVVGLDSLADAEAEGGAQTDGEGSTAFVGASGGRQRLDFVVSDTGDPVTKLRLGAKDDGQRDGLFVDTTHNAWLNARDGAICLQSGGQALFNVRGDLVFSSAGKLRIEGGAGVTIASEKKVVLSAGNISSVRGIEAPAGGTLDPENQDLAGELQAPYDVTSNAWKGLGFATGALTAAYGGFRMSYGALLSTSKILSTDSVTWSKFLGGFLNELRLTWALAFNSFPQRTKIPGAVHMLAPNGIIVGTPGFAGVYGLLGAAARSANVGVVAGVSADIKGGSVAAVHGGVFCDVTSVTGGVELKAGDVLAAGAPRGKTQLDGTTIVFNASEQIEVAAHDVQIGHPEGAPLALLVDAGSVDLGSHRIHLEASSTVDIVVGATRVSLAPGTVVLQQGAAKLTLTDQTLRAEVGPNSVKLDDTGIEVSSSPTIKSWVTTAGVKLDGFRSLL